MDYVLYARRERLQTSFIEFDSPRLDTLKQNYCTYQNAFL